MKYDIKNLNIWAEEPEKKPNIEAQYNCEITELNLSQRSFNCLRRASCNTIGDIIKLIENDENGLRNIRNLGARSEAEILEKIEEFKSQIKTQSDKNKTITLAEYPIMKRKDAYLDKNIWDSAIEVFHLSNYALNGLKRHGINRVRDLYATDPNNEPGWYAVRELFEKIPMVRKDTIV